MHMSAKKRSWGFLNFAFVLSFCFPIHHYGKAISMLGLGRKPKFLIYTYLTPRFISSAAHSVVRTMQVYTLMHTLMHSYIVSDPYYLLYYGPLFSA